MSGPLVGVPVVPTRDCPSARWHETDCSSLAGRNGGVHVSYNGFTYFLTVKINHVRNIAYITFILFRRY